nr:MAG TPA: hypothetical protein [Crassvirales sp.]
MDYREKVLYLLSKHNQDSNELKASISELYKQLNDYNQQISIMSKALNVPEFVDLDLPGGTKWMKCNIGAKKETDYGLYFQFGDTVGYSAEDMKALATWKNCPGNEGKSTASNTDLVTWDSKYIDEDTDYLKPCVDAAYVHTNGVARIPNYEDCINLVENTDSEFVTNFNGSNINGFKCMSMKDHSKYIFLPTSGFILNGRIVGGSSTLLSSRLYNIETVRAIMFNNNNNNNVNYAICYRNIGSCIRDVLIQ